MEINLHSERDAFNAFIDSQFLNIGKVVTLEEALTSFRAYQRELALARRKVQEAKTASEQGKTSELDIEELIREVTVQLATEGIR